MIKKFFTKLLHPPEYPNELPSKKGKIAYWIHWHIYCTDTGRGKVFGKVLDYVAAVGVLFLSIDKWGWTLSRKAVLTLSMGGFVLAWLTGWLYLYAKQDIVEGIRNRYRDVMFKEMYDKIKGEK